MHKTGDGAGGVRYPILVQLCEASISRAPALLVIVPPALLMMVGPLCKEKRVFLL